MIVVDHDTGRLVWAAPGRDAATLEKFFDQLGEDRCAQITHVSADAADWIATVVADRCPDAVRCADAFHVVAWATDALDEVRRDAWNTARGATNQRIGPPHERPVTPRSSNTPATPCGRTPRTSPSINERSWPGSPRPTLGCTAPTCSKKASGSCSC